MMKLVHVYGDHTVDAVDGRHHFVDRDRLAEIPCIEAEILSQLAFDGFQHVFGDVIVGNLYSSRELECHWYE